MELLAALAAAVTSTAFTTTARPTTSLRRSASDAHRHRPGERAGARALAHSLGDRRCRLRLCVLLLLPRRTRALLLGGQARGHDALPRHGSHGEGRRHVGIRPDHVATGVATRRRGRLVAGVWRAGSSTARWKQQAALGHGLQARVSRLWRQRARWDGWWCGSARRQGRAREWQQAHIECAVIDAAFGMPQWCGGGSVWAEPGQRQTGHE